MCARRIDSVQNDLLLGKNIWERVLLIWQYGILIFLVIRSAIQCYREAKAIEESVL